MLELKSEFIGYWYQIQETAKKCMIGFDIMQKSESAISIEEQEKLGEELVKLNIHDAHAVWYIGQMFININRAIMDNRPNLNLINYLSQVNGTLNAESYWTGVWNNDFSSEEAANLKALSQVRGKLISLL